MRSALYEVSRSVAPRLLPLYKSVNIVSLNLAGQTQSPISPCKPGSQHRAAASPASIGRRHLCKPECKPAEARGRETRMQTLPSLVGAVCSVCPLFLSSDPRLFFFFFIPVFFMFGGSGLVVLRGIHDWEKGILVFILSVFYIYLFLEVEYKMKKEIRLHLKKKKKNLMYHKRTCEYICSYFRF